ncbi:MAG: GIY-YIG nuclease family protein [Patescibacteria group bacterium]
MYYVYILKSIKDNDIYIGQTNNLKRRILEHNNGRVSSTKARRPFKILEFSEFSLRDEAVKIEREWKKGYKREEIKRKYRLI